jgi:hypothetical protein
LIKRKVYKNGAKREFKKESFPFTKFDSISKGHGVNYSTAV